MCGISGIYNSTWPAEKGLELCAKMVHALTHRGPDGHGLWQNNAGLVLGHRRLAIIDLSDNGRQPMESNGLTLTYNGEIYNHPDLRERLSRAGHRFRGRSDSETLLHALAEWGVEKTLDEIEGMFAFAVFDRRTNTLTLARDRLGEKPLYYGWQDQTFFFASELKAIMALPTFTKSINLQALRYFFKYNYIPAPLSVFEGVYKLPPAHFLQVKLAGDSRPNEPRRYWRLNPSPLSPAEAPAYQTCADQVEERLVEVIQNQSLAEVPLGTFLSGGIDSSAVTALLQKHSAQRIRSFSVGFAETAYDESRFAEKVAAHLRTDHTTLMVNAGQVKDMIENVADVFCEPFSDSSQLPTLLLAKLTREHVKVILSGDGGDELFSGYTRYLYLNSIAQKTLKIPKVFRQWSSRFLLSFSEEFFDSCGGFLPGRLKQWSLGQKIHKTARLLPGSSSLEMYDQVLSHWSPAQLISPPEEEPVNFSGLPEMNHLSFIEQMMLTDSLTYLPDDIMVKVDRSGMAYGLETRAPFLDHRLYELVWKLPLSYKNHNAIGKRVLKSILYKHVPQELFNRPKQGFAVPLKDWLRGDLREWAEDLLSSESLKKHSWLNANEVRRKWQEHVQGRNNWGYHLWDILMFESWYRRWM